MIDAFAGDGGGVFHRRQDERALPHGLRVKSAAALARERSRTVIVT